MMGALDDDRIDEVLREELVGRIAYVADGWPHIVPVTYVYDGTQHLFVHSAEGHKIAAMRKNPQVAFEVEQIREMASWRTVTMRGLYEELSRDAEERAMDLLAGKFLWAPGGTPPRERHEEIHRREGIVRPVLFRIRIIERIGRFQQT